MASRSIVVKVREFSTSRMRWGSGVIGRLSKPAGGDTVMGGGIRWRVVASS